MGPPPLVAERLGVQRAARLLESARIATPMLIGVLKPVVLLPCRVASGLGPREREAILAHELAHLARRDAWANLFQIIVQTVLFYHPVVWWIGSRARIERENAADDLAVRVCTDRLTYAGALARLAELEAATQSLALAATDGSVFARIRRILGRPADRETAGAAWIAGGVAIAACIGTTLLLLSTPVTAADDGKRLRVAAGESIQMAIDAAPPGAVIQLGEGEWKERIVISKPLTIEGAGWDKTLLRPAHPDPAAEKARAELKVRSEATPVGDERTKFSAELINTWEPTITIRGAEGVTRAEDPGLTAGG